MERREVVVIDPPRLHDLLVFVEQEINRVQRLEVRGVAAIASRLHQRVKEVHPGPAQLSAGFEKLLDLDGQDGAEEHRNDHDPLGGIHARAPLLPYPHPAAAVLTVAPSLAATQDTSRHRCRGLS
jgi:hypothetical protein